MRIEHNGKFFSSHSDHVWTGNTSHNAIVFDLWKISLSKNYWSPGGVHKTLSKWNEVTACLVNDRGIFTVPLPLPPKTTIPDQGVRVFVGKGRAFKYLPLSSRQMLLGSLGFNRKGLLKASFGQLVKCRFCWIEADLTSFKPSEESLN